MLHPTPLLVGTCSSAEKAPYVVVELVSDGLHGKLAGDCAHSYRADKG